MPGKFLTFDWPSREYADHWAVCSKPAMQSRKNCHFVVSIFCFYTTVSDPGKKVLSSKPAPSMLQATFFGFKTPVFLQLNAEDRPVFCTVCTSFAKSTRGTETKMAGQPNLFLQTWLNMEGFGQKWTTAPFTESFVEVLPHSYCPQLLQHSGRCSVSFAGLFEEVDRTGRAAKK